MDKLVLFSQVTSGELPSTCRASMLPDQIVLLVMA